VMVQGHEHASHLRFVEASTAREHARPEHGVATLAHACFKENKSARVALDKQDELGLGRAGGGLIGEGGSLHHHTRHAHLGKASISAR